MLRTTLRSTSSAGASRTMLPHRIRLEKHAYLLKAEESAHLIPALEMLRKHRSRCAGDSGFREYYQAFCPECHTMHPPSLGNQTLRRLMNSERSNEQRQARFKTRQLAVAGLNTFPLSEKTAIFRKRMAFYSAFALIVTILAGVGWLSYRNMKVGTEADHWVIQTHINIEELSDLLSSIRDAGAAVRSFIVTGDQNYLRSYQGSLSEIEIHLEVLRRLTAGNSGQQQRLAAITPLVAARLAELKDTLALREAKGSQAANEMFMKYLDRNILEKIRRLVAEGQREEERSLQVRIAAKDADTRATIHSVFLGDALGGLALLLLFGSLNLELARRHRAESEVRRHRDHLQDLVTARTQDLERAITELKHAEQRMQIFSQRIITAREEERKDVSAALHHDVGSMVVGVSANLDAVEEDLRSGNHREALEWLNRTREQFDKAVARLKRVAVQIRPPELDSIGVCAALQQLFSEIASHRSTLIHFKETLGPSRVIGITGTILYRIVQEAVSNAIKHGRAERVDVSVSRSKSEITLTVHDNGQGFDPGEQRKSATSQMGLRLMQEMATSIGGAFSVESSPRKGTTVCASLPLGTDTLTPAATTVRKVVTVRKKERWLAGADSLLLKEGGS